jgi:serine/threonine-protein kinase
MEYIEGHTLSGLLDETGPMSLPRAAGIIGQCADALHAAHDLGIVHRDLKPDNIMVITSRGRDTVKVVDFGIAKATDAKASGQKVTKTGLVVGTPEYMSPEQLSGDPTDGRSDLYSLALVFYRVITGRLPFEAETAQETMIKRLTDEPTPLAVVRPDLKFPPGVQRVLDRSLARTPADRYANAGEFGREVIAAAGTMTKADLEAGTQVVKPEELKKALSTVPATRVDPHVPRPSQEKKTVVADGAGKADRAVVADKAVRRTPVVPIAAAAVLLVGGASAFVMRDQLFGKPIQVATIPIDSTTVPDTTKRHDSVKATTGGQTTTGGRTTDSVTKPPRDTTKTVPVGGGTTNPPKPPVDLAAMARQVHDFSEDFEFTEDAAKLAQGKKLGQEAWDTPGLNNTARAEAAFVVSQALLKEQQTAQAKTWLQKAIALDPRKVWKDIFDAIP